MTETTQPLTGDRLLVAIGNATVSLFREVSGRGPSRCTAHWAGPDLLVILLREGFTTAERTLYEGGNADAVRTWRLALTDAIEDRLTYIVEGQTGRRVEVFMSASHQDPDYQLQAFTLEPRAR